MKVVSASRSFYEKFEALNTAGWRVSSKDGAAEILGTNPKILESKM
ncbi:MAG: hypothetical protein RDU01_12195 [Thermodesulfovibrionales bacterium]|nr:hypothetical protein [Thermodesulfovibrionales bacterium]